ncbi:MAG TPA: hypothetical protein V6D17_03760 [Candidatus Obscuribacterales bacterium]
MNNGPKLFPFSLVFPLLFGSMASADSQKDSSLGNLRNWDIIVRSFQGAHFKRGSLSDPITIYLNRPGASNAVAILVVKPDGTPNLNPDCFDYGPIPRLREITSAQAEQLWSVKPADQPKKDGIRTFDLRSYEPNSFKLDVEFQNDHLRKFRVRTNDCATRINNNWYEVK